MTANKITFGTRIVAALRNWVNNLFDKLEKRKTVNVAETVSIAMQKEHELIAEANRQIADMKVKAAIKAEEDAALTPKQMRVKRIMGKKEFDLHKDMAKKAGKLQADIDAMNPFIEVGIPIKPTGPLYDGKMPPRVIQKYEGPVPQAVYEAAVQADAMMAMSGEQGAINESSVHGMSPGQRLKFGKAKRQHLRSWAKDSYNLVEELVADWTMAVNSRRQYLSLSDEMRRMYMVDRILEIIASDVLNPDLDGKIVRLSSQDEKKDKSLQVLQDRFDFDVHLQSIAVDAINFGEWATRLETESDTSGLTDLDEGSVNQVGICAFYDRGYPSGFMVMMQSSNDFEISPPDSYAHFALGEGKLRIKLEDHFFGNAGQVGVQFDRETLDKELKYKLPEYIRVGKPVFWSVIDKLRILQILEQLIPAMKLSQITMSKLVSVKVPTNLPFDDVADMLEEYEELLNVQTGIDTSQQQVTLAEIMTAAGHIKLIPQFQDGKGALESLNVREDQSVDDILRAQNEIRQSILSSIGIPAGVVYGPSLGGGDNAGNRAIEMRQNSMYTRKIAMIQRAFSNYLRQIGMVHLANSGFDDVKPSDVEVKFLNTMADIGQIEKAEMDDALQEMVGRRIQFLKDALGEDFVTDLMRKHVHEDGVQDWLAASFKGLANGVHIFDSTEDLTDEDGNVGPARGDVKAAFLDTVKDNLFANITARVNGDAVNLAAKQMDLDIDVDPEDKHPHHDKVVDHVLQSFVGLVNDRLSKADVGKEDDPQRKKVKQAVVSAITNAFVDRIAQR